MREGTVTLELDSVLTVTLVIPRNTLLGMQILSAAGKDDDTCLDHCFPGK